MYTDVMVGQEEIVHVGSVRKPMRGYARRRPTQTISLGVGSLASGVSTETGLGAGLDGRLLLPTDVGIGGRS